VPLVPFSTTGWTWVNQGSATIVEDGGSVFLTCPTAAGENVRALVKALPAGTPTITLAVLLAAYPVNYCIVGLTLRESATQKLVSFQHVTGATGLCQYHARRNTNPTTFASSAGGPSANFITTPPIHFIRVRITATQYVYDYSFDGINFVQTFTENKNAFFTTAPDQVGLMVMNGSGAPLYVPFLSWRET
jgi:hypothetical protein